MRRGGGGRVDGEAQLGGKSERPKDAQCVLGKALLRCADAADDRGGQIRLPAKWVFQSRFRAPGHGVDGEIPAGQVLRQGGGEAHGVGMAVVSVGALSTEGGDFQGHTVQQDSDCAVLQAGLNESFPGKNFLHLLRQGGCGDVPVPGLPTQKPVPDAAANQRGLEACGPEPRQRGQSRERGVEVAVPYRVVIARPVRAPAVAIRFPVPCCLSPVACCLRRAVNDRPHRYFVRYVAHSAETRPALSISCKERRMPSLA